MRFGGDDLVEVREQLLDPRERAGEPVEEARRHVALQAADADVVRRHARAAQHLLQVPAQLARLDPVQERRHGAELEARRAEPGQVIAHARELARERAHPLAAPRDLAAEQLLDRHAEGQVREDRRVVVQPIGVRDRLVPGPALALLLEAAVQVADLHVHLDDLFAVDLEHDLHRAVGRRVRRAHRDDLRLGVQVAFRALRAKRSGGGHAPS